MSYGEYLWKGFPSCLLLEILDEATDPKEPVFLEGKFRYSAESQSGRGKWRQGQTKATAFSRTTGTLSPDASLHCFNYPFADVESQTRPTRGSSQVSLETHKFLKEQRKLFGRDTRTFVLYLEAHGRS